MGGHPIGRLLVAAFACVSLVGASETRAAEVPPKPLAATLELTAAEGPATAGVGVPTRPSGVLEMVSAETIRLATADGTRDFPVRSVRRLDLTVDLAADGAFPPSTDGVAVPSTDGVAVPSNDGVALPSNDGVILTLGGGGRLSGDRFVWDGETARLYRAPRGNAPPVEEFATVPIDGVDSVSWSPAAAGGGATPPDWLASLPERPEGDLVVVRRADGFECVECAILEIDDEHVVVLLDGERIPVRRERVAGLRWLRPAEPPPSGRVHVRVTGGMVAATTVHWSPERLVIDERMLLPASWLRSIDFAAGRTVRLATLEPERVDVQPLLAGTADSPRLTAFLAPRWVPDASEAEERVLVVRPRTALVWRVPPESRVFRVRAVAGVGRTSLVIGVDDREPLRRELVAASGSPADCTLEIDVAAARRLSVMVDVPAEAGPGAARLGGPVRLERAVFEP